MTGFRRVLFRSVCEEIVTRHEGRMDVGNAEGGGFLVTIRLPLEN